MITQLLNTLNTLVPSAKVLLVGEFNENIYSAFGNYFHTIEKALVYDETLVNHYDIVIVSSEDGLGIKQLILQNELLKLSNADTTFIEDMQDDCRIDQFLDKHSGSMMFINDDLDEDLKKLQDLDISKEIFKSISINLTSLALVFQQDKKLEHISELFLEFGQFLEHLDFDIIEPINYSAFDLLTTIIEDLQMYMNEMFVSKILKDIYIFEDSMQNNINYFEAKLFGFEVDDTEENEDLEFF